MDASRHAAVSAADSLALRYGAEAAPEAGPWNEQISLLLAHRSIRGYRPDAVPAGTLETLIAAAQSAATSSNLQTWSVVAVTDPDKKAALARVAANQKHIEQCPLFLVWVADISRNQRLGTEEGVTLESMPYQETFLVAAIDAALARRTPPSRPNRWGCPACISGRCATIRRRSRGLSGCRGGRSGCSGCAWGMRRRQRRTR
jgi:hypothetical protein